MVFFFVVEDVRDVCVRVTGGGVEWVRFGLKRVGLRGGGSWTVASVRTEWISKLALSSK
jgi:hypothetical protein